MSRSRGDRSVTSSSPRTTRPLDTCSSPAIIRRSVVFPHPDGPTSTMNSPSAISRLTSSTAFTPPSKTLDTCSTLTPPSVNGHRSAERLCRPLLRRDHGHRADQDRLRGGSPEKHFDRARLDDIREVPIVEAELADRDAERDPPRLARLQRQAQEALELALRPRDRRLRVARVELHDLVARPLALVSHACLDDELAVPAHGRLGDPHLRQLERRVAEPVTERIERTRGLVDVIA